MHRSVRIFQLFDNDFFETYYVTNNEYSFSNIDGELDYLPFNTPTVVPPTIARVNHLRVREEGTTWPLRQISFLVKWRPS